MIRTSRNTVRLFVSLSFTAMLVGIGLAFVGAGSSWLRATGSDSGASGSKRDEAFGRLMAVAPAVSAVIVLILGSAMLVRAGQSLQAL